MIDVIAVHYQEAVVASPVGADVDGRILVVVTVEVEPQLRTHGMRVNSDGYTAAALAQHEQHRFVHIVVDEHKRLLGRPYQVGGKLVGIEYLALVEDSFHRWQGGADKEINLLGVFSYGMLQLRQATVDRVPFQQVFLQYLVCPTAELNASA